LLKGQKKFIGQEIVRLCGFGNQTPAFVKSEKDSSSNMMK